MKMGYRKNMTAKQNLELSALQYKRRLEENRGFNFAYLNDELELKLNESCYNTHKFGSGINNKSTHSVLEAKKVVEDYRNKGYYARIICISNTLRIKEFTVWYKLRKQSK